MRRQFWIALLLIAVQFSSGCATFDPLKLGTLPESVHAADLEPGLIDAVRKTGDFGTAKAALQALVADSQTKCNTFMSGIIAREIGGNTYLDLGTTILSAAATAISGPLSWIHGLTAGSTILSGSRTALNSDYFAKATAGNYAQALQGTYFAQIATYSATLTQATLPANATVAAWASGEVPKILNIHFACGLGPAQASIAAQLAPSKSQAPGAATATATLTVSAATGQTAATDKADLRINALASSFTIPLVSVSIEKGDSPDAIAKKIVDAVTSAVTANISSITAKKGDQPGTVVLTSNSADNVQWQNPVVSGSSGITVTIAPATTPSPPNATTSTATMTVAAPPTPVKDKANLKITPASTTITVKDVLVPITPGQTRDDIATAIAQAINNAYAGTSVNAQTGSPGSGKVTLTWNTTDNVQWPPSVPADPTTSGVTVTISQNPAAAVGPGAAQAVTTPNNFTPRPVETPFFVPGRAY